MGFKRGRFNDPENSGEQGGGKAINRTSYKAIRLREP